MAYLPWTIFTPLMDVFQIILVTLGVVKLGLGQRCLKAQHFLCINSIRFMKHIMTMILKKVYCSFRQCFVRRAFLAINCHICFV